MTQSLYIFVTFAEIKKIDDNKYKLYDSKGEYEHAFQLEKNNKKYLVEWHETDGHYSIKIDDNEATDYYHKQSQVR